MERIDRILEVTRLILKRVIGIKYIISTKPINLLKKDCYSPNKGSLRIWKDQIHDIIRQGCPERGYWMYGFYNLSRTEQDKYINYESFRRTRNKLNFKPNATFTTRDRYNYLCILRDKFLFGRFLTSLNFPVVKDYFILDGKRNELKSISKAFNISSNESLDNLTKYNFDGICKIISGECGKGVFHIKCSDGKLSGEVENDIQLKKLIGNSQFLIQERIIQHPLLNNIYPNSINTMRLITILGSDGIVRTLPATIRFGTQGRTVDNWAMGGLAVAVSSDGILLGNGHYEFPVNNKMTESHHPDTNIRFDGFKIPYYKQAVEMAKDLHLYLYGIPCIGWDIAFTESGPVFIEGNDNFEITLNQCVHGGLKNQWKEAIGKV